MKTHQKQVNRISGPNENSPKEYILVSPRFRAIPDVQQFLRWSILPGWSAFFSYQLRIARGRSPRSGGRTSGPPGSRSRCDLDPPAPLLASLCWLCLILAPRGAGGPGDTGYWETGKILFLPWLLFFDPNKRFKIEEEFFTVVRIRSSGKKYSF